MFKKTAYSSNFSIEPLNCPVISDFVLDQNISTNQESIKTVVASIQASKNIDGNTSNDFDLEAEIKEHPDSLFVKCFAIKADETNDNGDHFSKDELRKAYPTFVGVPVFTNHQNTDINQARGKVVHSWWDEGKNGIMVIARVDSAAYPQLARGIKEKYIFSTSMGCRVEYSLCSICHNFATEPSNYCGHIKNQKTRKFSGSVKCSYHKNGEDKPCPVCGCAKGENKTLKHSDSDNQKVFEYNYGVHFIENSFVVNPACHDCGVTEVIDPQKFLSRIATLKDKMLFITKNANNIGSFCDDKKCIKIAGQKEIDDLNTALDLLSTVSQSMLNQKDKIDLEFLSDIVEVLASLQTVIDELTEQGYGRLQSDAPVDQNAPQQQNVQTEVGGPVPANTVTRSVPTPTSNTPVPQTTGKIHTGPAGQAGTVTSPNTQMARKKINLEKISKNILKKTKEKDMFLNLNNELELDRKKTASNKSISFPFIFKKKKK